MTRVAIVSLGRGVAMGEVRRVASWRQIFTAAGADVVEVPLAPTRRPNADGIVPVLAGRAVPERLAWSGKSLRDALRAERPDAVVVVSTRAYDPRATEGPWTLVLDQVDSLSRSYRDRADVVRGQLRQLGYRALAATHQRVEKRLRATPVRRVAAGWADARGLGAEWVPIVSDPTLHPHAGAVPDHDVLFFGTLRYPPNIDALERLGRLWPDVLQMRPQTTALIAGSAPPDRVRDLCATHQWELLANFDSLPAVAARARVAVAPLGRTAGMQIKILDAACLKLPQVVTSAAIAGYGPGLPLVPHSQDGDFAAEIVRLLDNRPAAAAEASTLRTYVEQEYSAEHWRGWAESLLA